MFWFVFQRKSLSHGDVGNRKSVDHQSSEETARVQFSVEATYEPSENGASEEPVMNIEAEKPALATPLKVQ